MFDVLTTDVLRVKIYETGWFKHYIGKAVVPVATALRAASADGTPGQLSGWFRLEDADVPVELQLRVQFVPYD